MADIREWAKGITFFIFITLLFYFLWHNVFLNIINFTGQDFFNLGTNANNSLAIIKTASWVSFVIMYIAIGGGYLIYTAMIGASNRIKTRPKYFLMGLGSWVLIMMVINIVFGLVFSLESAFSSLGTTTVTITNLQGQTITTPLNDSVDTASQFTYLTATIGFVLMAGVPFILILKGYGVDLWGGRRES